MQINSREDVRRLMSVTSSLPPNQRIVVLLYATHEQDPGSGAVPVDAKELAGEINMDPSLFSRLRGQLVTAGWMEKIEDTVYYRLTSKAGGDDNVVPMRQRSRADGRHIRHA
ncbi:replication initiation protein, RepL2 [Kitasatospora sp. NBC_01266]|jgi:DNA-binding MarR family transcriptional regulator|uniref:replication initiation protein, RepL2 n=1 Tax=Kitasatospora sp. NBC_01266 TaxID=2903572 RepID=UPI002E32A62E|nr:replication initiation protein, RepL2 [Kitasatospora sp. NBC_01266]